MIDVILVLIIAVLLAAAVIYIIKAKKKGVKCIGCPAAGSCQAGYNNSYQSSSVCCLCNQNSGDQGTSTLCSSMAEQITVQPDK